VIPPNGLPAADTISFSPADSDYNMRNSIDQTHEFRSNCPSNCEWHEFGHALFHTFLNTGDSSGPPQGFSNHGGFTNAASNDSLDEGFACILGNGS